MRGFFGIPCGPRRDARWLLKALYGLMAWQRHGEQDLTRPGPEGGRIVYASRISPRPLEAWRLGGLGRLGGAKSRPWAFKMGHLGSKMEAWASKMGSGASKMASAGLLVRKLEVLTPLLERQDGLQDAKDELQDWFLSLQGAFLGSASHLETIFGAG